MLRAVPRTDLERRVVRPRGEGRMAAAAGRMSSQLKDSKEEERRRKARVSRSRALSTSLGKMRRPRETMVI